jgi:hypothetical protein
MVRISTVGTLIQPDSNSFDNLAIMMLMIGITKQLDVSNGKNIQEIYVRSNDDEVLDREAVE